VPGGCPALEVQLRIGLVVVVIMIMIVIVVIPIVIRAPAVAKAVLPRNEPSLKEIGFIRLPPGAWPGLAIGVHPEDSNTGLNGRLWRAAESGAQACFDGPRPAA